MTILRYVGSHSAREITAADMKKAGVEDFVKSRFENGEPMEVDADVAKVLLEHPFFETEFVEVNETEARKLGLVPDEQKLPLTDNNGGGAHDQEAGAETTTGTDTAATRSRGRARS